VIWVVSPLIKKYSLI